MTDISRHKFKRVPHKGRHVFAPISQYPYAPFAGGRRQIRLLEIAPAYISPSRFNVVFNILISMIRLSTLHYPMNGATRRSAVTHASSISISQLP